MKDLHQRIRSTRTALGMSQAQFAKALGASQGSVSKWERGKEAPGIGIIHALMTLSNKPASYFIEVNKRIEELEEPIIAVQIKISGEIRARFSEISEVPEENFRHIEVPLPFAGPSVNAKGYIVVGNRSDKFLPDGGIAIIVSKEIWNKDLVDGDIVLVKRRNTLNQTELSLRRFSGPEQKWLWPITNDPEYQVPVTETDGPNDGLQVEIAGIVVASYRIEPAAWRSAEGNS